MPRLILFSGSQSPLAVRYPRPAKSPLVLPPLVHRALHTALDPQQPSVLVDSDTVTIPHPGALAKHAISDGEYEKEYETTVKIQLTEARDPSTMVGLIREALQVLAERKGLNTVDVVLLGLPEDVDDASWAKVWKSVTGEEFKNVKHWGTLCLGQSTLGALCEVRPPYVNELDVRDCETLPKEYIAFAASKGIQLWASGGGAGCDPLPSAELHNLLQEFQAKLSVAAPGTALASPTSLITPSPDGHGYDGGVKPSVRVDWVLSYTLLSSTRNIVRDKGYTIAASF